MLPIRSSKDLPRCHVRSFLRDGTATVAVANRDDFQFRVYKYSSTYW